MLAWSGPRSLVATLDAYFIRRRDESLLDSGASEAPLPEDDVPAEPQPIVSKRDAQGDSGAVIESSVTKKKAPNPTVADNNTAAQVEESPSSDQDAIAEDGWNWGSSDSASPADGSLESQSR